MNSAFIQFFIHILDTGYRSGIAVVVIAAARIILNALHVPKKYICPLWLLPFLRLALPVFPQSAFSLLPAQTSPASIKMTEISPPDLQIISKSAPGSSGPRADHVLPSAPAASSPDPLQSLLPILSVLWAVGICFFLLYGTASAVCLQKKLCMSIHKQENIYLADGIPAAFVLGILKPRIYLPSNISSEFSEFVICHEKMHIKRKDHIIKIILFILTSIYWFHPLIWAAYYFVNKDIEFACDEAVIRSKSEACRQSYAMALLSLSAHAGRTAIMPPAFSKGSPKKRIQHIIAYKKPLLIIAAAGVAAIALLSVGLLTNPVENDVQKADTKTARIDPVSSLDSPNADHTSKNSSGGTAEKTAWLEVKTPVISLSEITGADGVQLYYVDKNNIIFGGCSGLFVYSKTSQSIIRALDLKPIGCSYTQGDNACEVNVSKDGSAVYLHPMHSDEMYVYSTADNTL